MPAPILNTPRLRLRPHVLSDMEPLWAFFQGGRGDFMYPPESKTKLWNGFASEVGSWDLRGFGAWGVETQDGTFIGQVAINMPPNFPEREIGWLLLDGFEGHGYMAEAATAALHWAWAQGMDTLVSYINPQNTRSIALALRLGATYEPDALRPEGEGPEETQVYRHSHDLDGNPETYA